MQNGSMMRTERYGGPDVKPLILVFTAVSSVNGFGTSGIATSEGHFSVSFDVSNTGRRAGATVAQLYVGEESPTVPRPVKELKQFERVMLQPGETKHVAVDLDSRSFSFYDVGAAAWHANAGTYDLILGDSSASIQRGSLSKCRGPLLRR
jgi:beta-glucosidase